jgi:catechol 2,3-dioxygenase-like lactoylglutathione lyase family enzyme
MITGVHAMFYTPQADELRAFLRDKLGLPFVDTRGGWLIFRLHDVEVASHPADAARHQLSFYCDDLRQTMAELEQRGVEFSSGVSEEEWGWLTHFKLPGGDEVELYQAKYATEGARPA